jgi:hypothetical protein
MKTLRNIQTSGKIAPYTTTRAINRKTTKTIKKRAIPNSSSG